MATAGTVAPSTTATSSIILSFACSDNLFTFSLFERRFIYHSSIDSIVEHRYASLFTYFFRIADASLPVGYAGNFSGDFAGNFAGLIAGFDEIPLNHIATGDISVTSYALLNYLE